MYKKIKSSILCFFQRPEKQRIWQKILLLFLFFGLFSPLKIAQAQPIPFNFPIVIGGVGLVANLLGNFGGQIITESISTIVLAFLIIFLLVPFLISYALLGISIILLGIVTSPLFISLSYTGLDNPIVNIGWTLTRDLTNMAFIIILVIIGLATALKLSEYRWQKTLPWLVIIALLINFTPVILGLVVDASNIIMYFFIGDMVDFSFLLKVIVPLFNQARDAIVNISPSLGIELFAQIIAFMFFCFSAAFVLFAFAFLFLLRYIAIWTLVVLSPLAFAAYILPDTRSYFKLWWNHFFQWCIIGIAAGFFLYLAQHLLLIGEEGRLISGRLQPPPGEIDPTRGMIDALLPYSVAIVLCYIGLFAALSSSAMGASAVISAVQKGAKAAGKTTLGTTWRKTGTAVKKESAKIKRTYDAAQSLGLSRPKSAGVAIGRYVRRKAQDAAQKATRGGIKKTAIRTAAAPFKITFKILRSTAKGTFSGIGDVAKSFHKATFPKKKKGQILCSACGGAAPAASSFCPHCGVSF